MIVHQHSQAGDGSPDPALTMASAAGNGARTIPEIPQPTDLDITTILQQSTCSTIDISTQSFQDGGVYAQFSPDNHYSVPRLPDHGSIGASCDAPMSFRDRHRFLDGVYNSYPDPDAISAKNLEKISRRVGLLMEEVLSWFEDEKMRRSKLLASQQQQRQQRVNSFPPSPESSTTSGLNNTVTMTMSFQNVNSPDNSIRAKTVSSSPAAPPQSSISRKEGSSRNPRKHTGTTPDWQFPETKRQKISTEYPCPDCGKYFTVERWPEHIKRVHFPDFIWDCPKNNKRTGNRCGSKPFFRPDNFATHLRGEHECETSEVSRLKVDCKFKVVNFFHTKCGFCEKRLKSRNESIEHIKNHLRQNLEKVNPSLDLGISLWRENCGSEHKLQRGVHYQIDLDSVHDAQDADSDDENEGGPNEGNPGNSGPDSSEDAGGSYSQGDGNDGGSSNDSSFFSSQELDFMGFAQNSPQSVIDATSNTSAQSSFGLEGLVLPFRSIRKLGAGGHGSVDEVACSGSEETFARKSVAAKREKQTGSSQMLHLRNELAILKKLSHSHLVKLIGAYTDTNYSHIIMTPVADQNLADYMRTSISRDSEIYLRWMGCLASAMSYLHEKQVQHLDVKPQNILVQGNDVLLADFGTAKSLFESGAQDGVTLALTPMYSAPETILHGYQDYKTDVFSLGCVFSEMLTRSLGKSLGEFENFRSMSSQKSFHCTIQKTQEWIKQMISDLDKKGSKSCELESLSHQVIGMLSASSFDRPTATQTSSSFAQAGYCCFLCMPDCLETDIHESNNSQSQVGPEPTNSTIQSSDVHLLQMHSPTYEPFSVTPSDLGVAENNEKPFGNHVNDHVIYSYPDVYNFPLNSESGFEQLLDSTNQQSPKFVPYFSPSNVDTMQPYKPYSLDSNLSLFSPALSRSASTSYELDSPLWQRPSLNISSALRTSRNSVDSAYYSENSHRERCTYPDCGKAFKDLKAHLLTHQVERPEKCPIQTCDYHSKGFARKYDKNRHTLTHFKGTMVCGFCPGSGTSAEKSFNRADVFKRHLTSVHAVEQTPPNSRKKTSSNSSMPLSGYAPDATGGCSTCSQIFISAQDFYEHLDDCVLRIVQQGIEEEQQQTRAKSPDLGNSGSREVPVAIDSPSKVSKESDIDDEIEGQTQSCSIVRDELLSKDLEIRKSSGNVHSRGGVPLSSIKGRKKRKDYPTSWGYPTSQTKGKKKVLCIFDGPRRLWKDDIILDAGPGVRMKVQEDEKPHIADLDVQTVDWAEGFRKVGEVENGLLTVVDWNCVDQKS